jgi:hypothetical protein
LVFLNKKQTIDGTVARRACEQIARNVEQLKMLSSAIDIMYICVLFFALTWISKEIMFYIMFYDYYTFDILLAFTHKITYVHDCLASIFYKMMKKFLQTHPPITM